MASIVQHHSAGLTVHETGGMGRAMHALRDGDRTWLIDPFHAAEFRDASANCRRWLESSSCSTATTATASRSPAASTWPCTGSHLIPDSGLEVVPVISQRFWREVALWVPATHTLVVAEAVGTAPLFALGARRACIRCCD